MCFLISSVTSGLCELLTGVMGLSVWCNGSKSCVVLPLPKVFTGLRCFLFRLLGFFSSMFRLWASHLKYPKKCKMKLGFKR